MQAFVSGASGYVGSRLIPSLLGAGHSVVAGFRDPAKASGYAWADQVEVRPFDLQDADSARAALTGCEVGYFLVHSMTSSGYVDREAEAARNFAAACEAAGCRSMVYLSGIVPEGELSDHLTSRLQVEEILTEESPVPAMVFRAAVVLGAGSTSFELIRRLVQRMPVLPAPQWLDHRVQPVAAADVVQVLIEAGESTPWNGHRDLVGPTVLSYPELISLFAEELGLSRTSLPLPDLSYDVAGPVMAKITGMPENTVTELVKSMGHDMVGDPENSIIGRIGAREAVRRAVTGAPTGTAADGDRQTAAGSDPDWVGDASVIDESGLRSTLGHWRKLLQGAPAELQERLRRALG